MKLSIVNGERRDPQKGLLGQCIGCGQPMIPKCGKIKIWHWAHKSNCECDRWWENETEWHRNWKNNFPIGWQEIRQKAADGEWHIADVKTEHECVIEFQHSFLKVEERVARNIFYGKRFAWVVDGLTRKNDRQHFESILKNSRQIRQNIPLIQLPFHEIDFALLRDWSDCDALVFFDFGTEYPLWCLFPKSSHGCQYLVPVQRQQFVALHVQSSKGLDYSSFEAFFKAQIFLFENPQPVQQHQALVTNQLTRQKQIKPSSAAEFRALNNYIARSQPGGRRRYRF